MKNHNHIIKNQIVDIKVSSEIDYHKLKDKISHILQKLIYSKLGIICDKYSRHNIYYNINNLEIDLGKIALDDISSILVEQVPKKFEIALCKALENFSKQKEIYFNSEVEIQTPSQELEIELQTVNYFLNNGSLPWWNKDSKKTLNNMLIGIAAKNSNQTKQLLFSLNKSAWNRLILQQNDYQLLLIVKILLPEWRHDLDKLHKELQQLIYCTKIGATLSKEKLRQSYWSFIFAATKSNEKNIITFVNKLISYLIFITDQVNYEQLIRHTTIQIITLNKQALINHPAITSWAKEVNNKNQTLFQIFNDINKVMKELSVLSLDKIKKAVIANILKELRKFIIIPNILVKNYSLLRQILVELKSLSQELSINNNSNKFKPLSLKLTDLKKQTQDIFYQYNLFLQNDKESNPFPLNETLYVENAGLILYWVYLKNLFIKLGLLNKSQAKFINKKISIRATLLLNLFVYGHVKDIPEYELPLNKILCGVPLAQPIPSNLRVKQEERQEFENLTSVLMSHWGALGKITSEGFRQAFIQRSGSIKRQDGQWLLRIEKKTQDILLDKLPWSINVIKLPWMNNHIIVEW